MATKHYYVEPYRVNYWGKWLLKEGSETIFDHTDRDVVIAEGHIEAEKSKGILVIRNISGEVDDILSYETGEMVRHSEMPPF